MATASRAPSTAAAPDFSDPRASLQFLLNPNTPLSEVDTAAAEGALAMGGMAGSPFAANNMLRLRDSERINRLQIGQNLLQPYLQRDFAAGQQNQQIAAQAASDALKESGAMARLSAEGQQRLQLALIQGDQQAADRLLTESGLDRRQASSLAAGLQESTMRNQTQLLGSLLPYALGNRGGAGGAQPPIGGSFYLHNSGIPGGGTMSPEAVNWSANARGAAGGGGQIGSRLGTTLGPVLDRILKGYGLS